MALEPCVATILRTLSIATLRALCDAATAQQAIIATRLTKLLVNRTSIQLKNVKLEAVQAAYEAALAPVQEALSFYPTGVARLVDTCTEFGDFLTAPQEVVTTALAVADNVLYRVREQTAIIDDINTEMARLNDLSTLLTDVCALIEIIIVELTSPAAA